MRSPGKRISTRRVWARYGGDSQAEKSLPRADESADPFKDNAVLDFVKDRTITGISSHTRIPGYRYACHEARYRRGRRIFESKSKSKIPPLACAAWDILVPSRLHSLKGATDGDRSVGMENIRVPIALFCIRMPGG